jgi:hypothetical protein
LAALTASGSGRACAREKLSCAENPATPAELCKAAGTGAAPKPEVMGDDETDETDRGIWLSSTGP